MTITKKKKQSCQHYKRNFVQSSSIPFSYPMLERPVLTDAMYLLHNPHDATTGRLFYHLLSTAAVIGCHANALTETVYTVRGVDGIEIQYFGPPTGM